MDEYIYVYECFVHMHVCVPHMYTAHRGQGVFDLLEFELQMSYHVGVE